MPYALRAAALAGLCLAVVHAACCPFCSAPSLTLSEQATQSDVVLLAEWKGTEKDATDDGEENASVTFEVRKVLKGPFKTGQTIKQAGYQPGEKGEPFLLTGIGADVVQWDIPTPFTEAAFKYLSEAPAPQKADGEKVSYRQRLPYFMAFLESPDETIANDAYGEFANAPYEEIVAVKDSIPRDKVRGWVLDPATSPGRLGLYGLLLGLAGTDDDAAAMEKLIAEPTSDFRIGLDGVMSGYLLLDGEAGLHRLRELKFRSTHLLGPDGEPVLDENGEKLPVPFSETYAAMQAVRFMWEYGGGRIPAEKLREALRDLLGRSELTELVVADLARWKDWSAMDRLVELYDAGPDGQPGLKRSVIRYLDAAAKDLPDGERPEGMEDLPGHVKRAREHLAAIEAKDPETVEEVRRREPLLE